MKRTLLALACSTLFVGAAHAEYSIYGLLDGSIGKSIPDAQAKERVGFHSGGDSDSGQGNSTTRIGVKGSTDVGSGIKANFKFETGGITSGGDVKLEGRDVNGNPVRGPFFNRQAWFGVSGSMGEVRLGRQDSVPFQTFIGYDLNGASNGVSAWGYSGVATSHFARQSASLQYLSPSFGGVTAQAGLQLKNKADKAAGGKDVVSGAVTYATGGLSLTGTFQSKEGTGGDDFFGVFGSYGFGIVKLSLGYQDAKTTKGMFAGAQVTVADINIGAIYAAQTKNAAGKGSVIELFVNKEILKGTYAYAEAGIADKKVSGGKGTGYAVGVIYTF